MCVIQEQLTGWQVVLRILLTPFLDSIDAAFKAIRLAAKLIYSTTTIIPLSIVRLALFVMAGKLSGDFANPRAGHQQETRYCLPDPRDKAMWLRPNTQAKGTCHIEARSSTAEGF